MSKSVTLLLVLVFLLSSCTIAIPAFSSADTVEDSWASKTPMQVARAELGVAVVKNKIYAIGGDTYNGMEIWSGGFLEFNGEVIGTNEEYDPATDNWTFKESMPTPRYGFAIATCQDKIYCIGGAAAYSQYTGATFTGVNEVYDPATDTWETKTAIPIAKTGLQANTVNGKIYVIDSSGTNYVYDPANDSWTTKAPMPTRIHVYSYASAVLDNKIYVISEILMLNQIYDPESDSWSNGTAAPSGIRFGAAGATIGVFAPKRIYVIGEPVAKEQGGPLYSNQAYTPENDNWIIGADLPINRENLAVAVVKDTLYAIGGSAYGGGVISSFAPSAVNEQYTPFGYGTVPPVVSVVSPGNNEMYASSNISLAFTVNRAVDWLGYSIDGQDNITINGNTTIAGLTNGVHNITVYAKDTFENTGASETIIFSVAEETESFSTALVAIASGILAVILCLGLLVYFRERKR